jgi:glycosyltransferase involved in cell wall biosynthesis
VMFEEDEVVRRQAAHALGDYDSVATACRWAEDVLRDAGLTTITTIPQGIDVDCFKPRTAPRQRFQDRFVVFSGGKFELRKAQDAVVMAFRAFAARHPDALLVAAWHNPFPASVQTMIASPYLPFQSRGDEPLTHAIRRWVTSAGIDPACFELMPHLPHAELAALYADTDVGLFPNRCEGATNLVLMEYMACGRPAVATDFSGHRDVVTADNSLLLRASKSSRSRSLGEVRGHWCEPNIEEIVESLEEAYRNRTRLAALGRQAATDLADWTWDRAAGRFLDVVHASAS